MSVLIKGMEMPKNCLQCYCTDTEYGECALDPEKRCPEDYGQRAEWCPLVEVPPHGRAIDADVLLLKLLTAESGKVYKYCYPCKEILQEIKDNPTVIPVEESNMDSFIRIFEEDDEEDGMDSFIRILKD